MPTKAPAKTQSKPTTGADQPQDTGQQEASQGQRLPSIRASVSWLNPNDDESVRAKASLTSGGAFAIHGIRVINSAKGDFVSMPSYKGNDGYKDIFHAVTADARQQMNDAVMQAYEQKLADQEYGQRNTDQGHEPPDMPEDTGMQGMSQ